MFGRLSAYLFEELFLPLKSSFKRNFWKSLGDVSLVL